MSKVPLLLSSCLVTLVVLCLGISSASAGILNRQSHSSPYFQDLLATAQELSPIRLETKDGQVRLKMRPVLPRIPGMMSRFVDNVRGAVRRVGHGVRETMSSLSFPYRSQHMSQLYNYANGGLSSSYQAASSPTAYWGGRQQQQQYSNPQYYRTN